MNPIITIACHLGDAAIADRLITEIYHINRKQPQSHAIIGFASDVHAELKETIRVSAGLAFESFEELEIRPLSEPTNQKYVSINSVFQQITLHIYKTCKLPFLWLEPDCIPTKTGWLTTLAEAYEKQPRSHMGNHLLIRTKENQEFRFTGRVGIYDPGLFLEIQGFFQSGPFERTGAQFLVPATSRTRLIQFLPVQVPEDVIKVWPEAVLVHGDKRGILRDSLVPKTNGHSEELLIEQDLTAVPPLAVKARPIADLPIIKRRGRPPKVKV